MQAAGMTFAYIPHLILAGLMGIHSGIITVREVSVKAGGSISIPCLYERHYRNHVKYLCEGQTWSICSYVVETNKPQNSEKFSISDDTNQTIFTVTINNLTDMDSGHYWCAVQIEYRIDDKQDFWLSVTTDTPMLYVDQEEITAFERGRMTVMCRYKYAKEKKWCGLGTCVTSQTGTIKGTTVTINASVPNVFTVTMSELRTDSSGWYWCATGDFQMPVHITVHELTSTTTTSMSPSTANFTGTLPTTTQHSSLLTSAEPDTAQPTDSTTNGAGGESLQDEHKSSNQVTILICTIISLLLVVIAAFFGWRMIRLNKTKPEGPDTTAQNHIPEESVTYSTIVIKDSVPQRTEPADGGVIYSTLK